MTEGIARAFIPSLPLAALAALLLVPVARRLAPTLGLIDRPRPDRFHARPVPLLGGPVCIVAAALGAIGGWVGRAATPGSTGAVVSGTLAAAAVFGTASLMALGLVDDRLSIQPLRKGAVIGGILAITILLWRPSGGLGGPLGWGITWTGGMIVINAWNYLDHADGIFATVAAVSLATLFLAWPSDEWTMARPILAALCGSLLGYLFWNAPPARIFLGDAGSLPLGLLIFLACAFLVDRGLPSMRPTVLASNAIPIVDACLVTVVRLREGRNPFRGGRDHSGHRLTRRFGGWRALIVVAAASLLFGAAASLLGPDRTGFALSLIGAGMLASFMYLDRIPPPA